MHLAIAVCREGQAGNFRLTHIVHITTGVQFEKTGRCKSGLCSNWPAYRIGNGSVQHLHHEKVAVAEGTASNTGRIVRFMNDVL